MDQNINNLIASLGTSFYLLIAWTLFWKAWALWVAARKGSKAWYIAMLILNTVGILEILYIFIFSKKISDDNVESANNSQ